LKHFQILKVYVHDISRYVYLQVIGTVECHRKKRLDFI
jgi:hypothetical protein